MKIKVWFTQNVNWIVALTFTLGLMAFAGIRFDYYFDLNDDVLLKDILMGAYTGTPESRNVYMLWPIGAFISLLYRFAGKLPWYGLFLTTCHYVCIFLILKRSLFFYQTTWKKVEIALTETVLLGSLLMNHFILIQYTVTSALLAGTAAFLFLTTPKSDNQPVREFIEKSIPAMVLVILAFLIRSKMLLLLFPLICVAGIIRWGSEKVILTKEHAVQYFSVFGLILMGFLVGQGTHMLAYSSTEWRDFAEFNDNRTEIYDFLTIPSYEGNEAFYRSIGLTESEKVLFDNYNFGMDEEIDEKIVGEIAAYAKKIKNEEKPFGKRLNEKFSQYIHRFTSGYGVTDGDFPWNYAIIIGYLLVCVLSFANKEIRKRGFWKLVLLFGVRTLLWLYILMYGKSPDRVTHSFYLMELCILGAMMFVAEREFTDIQSDELTKRSVGRQIMIGFCMCVFLLFGLTIGPEQIAGIDYQLNGRAYANDLYQELFKNLSTGDRADNFYFIDVFSWSSISEKAFAYEDNSLDNHDIMGGWICKSPLQRKKLEIFGVENVEQSLRDSENVFFVTYIDKDMDWMRSYYAGHNTPVEIHLVETIRDKFGVYAVDVID